MNSITLGGYIGMVQNKSVMVQGRQSVVFETAMALRGAQNTCIWIPCVFFGKPAEWAIEQGIAQGDYLVVNGELKAESWMGKDGQPKEKLKITVRSFSRGAMKPQQPVVQTQIPVSQTTNLDDIPF
jgi:single-stranded DNA-binding protein